MVRSDLGIVSMLLTDEWLEKYLPLLGNRRIEEGVFVAPRKLLEEIVGYRLHQGIMAIGRIPQEKDIFETKRSKGETRLIVGLDGIANSENMGVIVRNCAAFGADAVIVGETSCDPFLRRAVRNSMGTIFDLPTNKSVDLSKTLRRLHTELGTEIVAAHPQKGSARITQVDLTGDICIVFGSEGDGISPRVLEECGARLTIPMRENVDSINVGSSVGVVLYEAVRQRGSVSQRHNRPTI